MVLVSYHRVATRGGRDEASGHLRRSPPGSKGLRHGYAINAVTKGVPLHMLSKWMGHSILEITAIYANAMGEEQQAIAARMWS